MNVVENVHLDTMTSTVPKLNAASEWVFRKWKLVPNKTRSITRCKLKDGGGCDLVGPCICGVVDTGGWRFCNDRHCNA